MQAEEVGTTELDESFSKSSLFKLKKACNGNFRKWYTLFPVASSNLHFYLLFTYILPFSFLGSMIKQKGLDCVIKPCDFISVWQGLSALKDLMLLLDS